MDEVGERLVGAALPDRRGGRGHRGDARGVGGEREHLAAHPLGGEVGVDDEQPAAGGDDLTGVEPLLAVADRQRDVDRRQPDAVSSQTVLAPERQTTRSAAA